MSGLAGRFVCVLCLITLLLAAVPGHAGSPRSIYVPVYSSVVYGNKERTLSLTTMLSVRNTDARLPVTLTEVRYVNEKGQTVRNYLSAPPAVAPTGVCALHRGRARRHRWSRPFVHRHMECGGAHFAIAGTGGDDRDCGHARHILHHRGPSSAVTLFPPALEAVRVSSDAGVR